MYLCVCVKRIKVVKKKKKNSMWTAKSTFEQQCTYIDRLWKPLRRYYYATSCKLSDSSGFCVLKSKQIITGERNHAKLKKKKKKHGHVQKMIIPPKRNFGWKTPPRVLQKRAPDKQRTKKRWSISSLLIWAVVLERLSALSYRWEREKERNNNKQ